MKKLTEMEIKESIERLRLNGFTGGDKVRVQIFESRSLMQDVLGYLVQPAPIWKEEYNQVADWLMDNRGKGLLVMGPCGTGKSLVCGKVVPVLLQKVMRLICTQYTARELNTRLSEIMRQKIVYIDDVGTEPVLNDYGTVRQTFSELVDEAERGDKLLIVSTNLDADHLAQRYGERTLDRLRGLTRLVAFTGQSMRK